MNGTLGWFIIQKSITVSHHVNRLKKKIDAEKVFDKIQHLLMNKNFWQPRNRGELLQLNKETLPKKSHS